MSQRRDLCVVARRQFKRTALLAARAFHVVVCKPAHLSDSGGNKRSAMQPVGQVQPGIFPFQWPRTLVASRSNSTLRTGANAHRSIIPDGTITAAHLVKTPAYIQIHGFWDGTRINIVDGDTGGELDPHGAKNLGNPIGGNVTTNLATGQDVFYEEWMSFISFDQFCLRICTAEVNGTTTALQCEHELDIMGCRWVMAITDFEASRTTGFTECEGEVAMAPGLYPLKNGTTSTFRQRYTGTWTNEEKETGIFTVGQLVTPTAPAFWPKSSNCKTYSTISNGVDMKDLMVKAAPTVLREGSAVPVTGLPTTTPATVTTPTSVPPSVTPTSAGAGASDAKPTDGAASSDSAAAGAETTKNGGSAAAGEKSAASALSVPAILASIGGVALGALALF